MTLSPCPEITSDRLLLRGFQPEDFAQYSAYHTKPEVYRFLYCPVPDAAALAAQFQAAIDGRMIEDGDCLRLAVIARASEAVIGEVLLKLANRAALQAEIGYIFNPDHAGRGYATEAVRMMLGYGFESCGFHRIFARLDPLNAGSVGVIERLGFRREAHLLQNDRFNGVWGDEYIYAMLASDWRQAG